MRAGDKGVELVVGAQNNGLPWEIQQCRAKWTEAILRMGAEINEREAEALARGESIRQQRARSRKSSTAWGFFLFFDLVGEWL